MSRTFLAWLMLLPAAFAPECARPEASLFIFPTLVELTGNRRSAEVTISNRGDEAGTFEIEWTDMSMTEEGGLVRQEQQTDWSLQPYIRYSPRRTTLAPAESQVIRIALRPDDTAEEREYYSHMRVVTINSSPSEQNIEPGAGTTAAPQQAPSVSITARTAIAIPVIWRNSRTEPAATIDAVAIDHEAHAVTVDVRRDGLLSTRGYLHLLTVGADGKIETLADPVPLIIYPTVQRRTASVPLPAGVTFADLPPRAAIGFSADEQLTGESTFYATRPILTEQ